MAQLEAIFIPPVARDAVVPVREVEVRVDGLAGDRYAAGAGTFSKGLADGRAVTLMAAEDVEAIRGEHGLDLSDGSHRRNLVTRGVDLLSLVHQRFRIGTALLRGNRPCPPCGHLSKLIGHDAKALLHRRGGLRADVIEPGRLKVGDAIEAEARR